MSSTTNPMSPKRTHVESNWKTILECAALEVFEMMAGARLEPNPQPPEKPTGSQTAIVGMAGALCGMTTIRCSTAVATKLASLMLGQDAASNPSTIHDALGELCNMVAGNFKSKISNLADHCMLSVPTVITGEDYSVDTVEPNEGITVPLLFNAEPIWVSLIVQT